MPTCFSSVDWFIEDVFLGVPVMRASTLTSFNHEHFDWNGKPKKQGIAPGHALDQRKYTEGLKPGSSLSEWMHKSKLVWKAFPASEPGSVSHDD